MVPRQPIKVAAIFRSDEAASCLANQAEHLEGVDIVSHIGTIASITADSDLIASADLVLIDTNPSDPSDVEKLSELVTALKPHTLVAATAADISLADVRSLMRTGVVDVLPQPISVEDLRSATRHVNGAKVLAEGDSGSAVGSIITFMNCGGGSGATTLVVQSSYMLAALESSERADTCVVDLDVQLGSAALYMDIGTKSSVADLLGAPDRLDASLFEVTIGHHVAGVDILAAPNSTIPLDRLTPDFIDTCIALVRERYRYGLIDIPNVWTPWTYQALNNSDLIVLVMQLTVTGVRRAKRQMATLRDSGLGHIPVRLVANRVDKRDLRRIRLKEAEKVIGTEISHCIPAEYETVVDAGNQGVALSKVRIRSKASSVLKEIVDDMVLELTSQRDIRL